MTTDDLIYSLTADDLLHHGSWSLTIYDSRWLVTSWQKMADMSQQMTGYIMTADGWQHVIADALLHHESRWKTTYDNRWLVTSWQKMADNMW